MIGLRERERDAELPALAGEPELCAPPLSTVRGWIEERLLLPGAPALERVAWEYARWKPGVSLTCAYGLRFADGAGEVVVAKRYRDGKDRILSARPLRGQKWRELSPRLAPRVAVREARTVLFAQVADRELGGTSVLLDRRRTARLLRECGLAREGEVRRRRMEYELVRYKPERRAVYRLGVKLRDAERSRFRLGCRLLPAAVAARVAANRRRFEAAEPAVRTPALAGASERHGLLLEPWLDVTPAAPDAFDHAERAGAVLAALHGTPLPAGAPFAGQGAAEGLEPLFRVDASLAPPRLAAEAFARAPRAWCHGDFHPDQVALSADGEAWLLDLDSLGAGDPARDLASWIADAALELRDVEPNESARPLLAGYARGGGEPADERRLRTLVADELVRRAAATVRRLEAGAVARARRALELARELA